MWKISGTVAFKPYLSERFYKCHQPNVLEVLQKNVRWCFGGNNTYVFHRCRYWETRPSSVFSSDCVAHLYQPLHIWTTHLDKPCKCSSDLFIWICAGECIFSWLNNDALQHYEKWPAAHSLKSLDISLQLPSLCPTFYFCLCVWMWIGLLLLRLDHCDAVYTVVIWPEYHNHWSRFCLYSLVSFQHYKNISSLVSLSVKRKTHMWRQFTVV